MEENKIPTYREFLLNRFVEGKSIDVEIVAIEFAKMHVKKALETQQQKLDSVFEGRRILELVESYPLENIK